MRRIKAAMSTALVAGIATLLTVSATNALASPGAHHPGTRGTRAGHARMMLIDASLAPSMTADPMFHHVGPGAKPWKLAHGTVMVTSAGLNLHVNGLLIPGVGTGPVKTISASLYCGADMTMKAAATSPQVALSSKGDAVIEDRSFMAPATCLAPVVLVHPNGVLTSYIAVSGARP